MTSQEGLQSALGLLTLGALPSVDILEAHDVILTEVGARLYFDDLERRGAGILDAVLDAQRDEGRLVLLEHEHLIPARDARRAGDHHPVLGAMAVQLQRERAAGLHLQALHLEARS